MRLDPCKVHRSCGPASPQPWSENARLIIGGRNNIMVDQATISESSKQSTWSVSLGNWWNLYTHVPDRNIKNAKLLICLKRWGRGVTYVYFEINVHNSVHYGLFLDLFAYCHSIMEASARENWKIELIR